MGFLSDIIRDSHPHGEAAQINMQSLPMEGDYAASSVYEPETEHQKTSPDLPVKNPVIPKNTPSPDNANKLVAESLSYAEKDGIDIAVGSIQRKPDTSASGLTARSANAKGDVNGPTVLSSDNVNPSLSLHHPVKEEKNLSEKTFPTETIEAPNQKPESAIDHHPDVVRGQSTVAPPYPHRYQVTKASKENLQRKPDGTVLSLNSHSTDSGENINGPTVLTTSNVNPSSSPHHPVKEQTGISEDIFSAATIEAPNPKPESAIDHHPDVVRGQSTVVPPYPHSYQITKSSKENLQRKPDDAAPGLNSHNTDSKESVNVPMVLPSANVNPSSSFEHPVKEQTEIPEEIFPAATVEAPNPKPESAIDHTPDVVREQSTVVMPYSCPYPSQAELRSSLVQITHKPERYQEVDHTGQLTQNILPGKTEITRDQHESKSNAEPRVHVGRIDIVIAAPSAEIAAGLPSRVKDRPATDFTSRLYLRNL